MMGLPLIAAAPNVFAKSIVARASYQRAAKLPPALRAGDMVGLVGPASAGDDISLERAVANLETLGFKVKNGEHLLDRFGYLAGKDYDRAADINAMFADPAVKAIFAIRGGWGSARALRYLDWPLIRKNPKLVIGYSDITSLHLAIAAQAGFPTIHGPNGSSGWEGLPTSSFRAMAMDADLFQMPVIKPDAEQLAAEYISHNIMVPGKARGRLLGGNLTVLSSLVGTPWMPDMTGAILFLEDVDEAEYRIDRMLTQLGEAGFLSKINGFIFGQCRRCKQKDEYTGFPLISILQQHIAPLGIPAFAGGHFGHLGGQYCLPMGVEVEMNASTGVIRMLQPLVR